MNTPMAEARPFEAPNPAAGASAAANPPTPPQILNPPAGLLWLLGIGLLGCLILLSVAVARHELALVSGAIWMLGATTLGVAVLALILLCRALSIQLITALSKDGPPRFERHWGGIGGCPQRGEGPQRVSARRAILSRALRRARSGRGRHFRRRQVRRASRGSSRRKTRHQHSRPASCQSA